MRRRAVLAWAAIVLALVTLGPLRTQARPPPALASAAPTPVAATPVVTADDLAYLRSRCLLFPVPAVSPQAVRDTFADRRGAGAHEALDVPAPRGAPAVAVDDGMVVKLFASVPGGHTVYLFDAERRFAYYYAHLDAYAEGLVEGRRVARGEVIGYVGTTGNAAPASPHLHFAIFKLEAEPRWWRGTAINPHPLVMGPEVPAIGPPLPPMGPTVPPMAPARPPSP